MTTAFTAAIKSNQPQAPGSIPVAWATDGAPHSANPAIENKGRLKVNPLPNQDMTQLLGINLQSMWSIEGNRESLDVSKLTRHMSSGEFRSGVGIVERMTKWPHECLNPMACGDVYPKDHWALDRIQFASGMIGKMLAECSPANLDKELASKLLFLNTMLQMSFSTDWNQVLRVAHMTFSAYENRQLEWDNWAFLEKYLERAQNRTRLLSSFPSSSSAKSGAGKPGIPAPGISPALKNTGSFKGVPHVWIKSSGLCLRWNMGKCTEFTSDHFLPDKSTFVKHVCAGCLSKKLGDVREHCLNDCKQGPFQLFR